MVIRAGVMDRGEACTDGYSYACPVLGLPDGIRGCRFVLDGVLTKTAKADYAAWKEVFDGYLHEPARQSGQPFVPFDPVADCGEYTGGTPGAEGTRSFLKSRRIELPDGREDDPPGAQTVYGLATARTRSCWGGSVRTACKRARARPVTSGLSETRGCAAPWCHPALTATCLPPAGIKDLFETRVDGMVAVRKHLPGKPALDTFLAGARALGLDPAAAVSGDAVAGVAPGRAGGFGFGSWWE
jgi:beta-phosphoglucomutase-like phosphatase (HAD superfamily)